MLCKHKVLQEFRAAFADIIIVVKCSPGSGGAPNPGCFCLPPCRSVPGGRAGDLGLGDRGAGPGRKTALLLPRGPGRAGGASGMGSCA